MKTMCPPGYHHNGFVATHALAKKPFKIKIIFYHRRFDICLFQD